jgi:SAM-dependent methyltransferase
VSSVPKVQQSAAPPEPTPFDDGEIYDLLFKDFGFDLDFYLGLVAATTGPVLEVSCGTGRVLLRCLQRGADIEGIDLSPGMLETLRHKAEALGLGPEVAVADMRAFSRPRRYQLIIIPFNGFVHCLTSADQLAALRCCRAHLLPSGQLVLNIFYPGLEILSGRQGEPVLEAQMPHPETGLPVRIYDTRTLDRIGQIQHSLIEIQELDAAGQVARSHRSRTAMRWTFKPEMELLLRAAGFARWKICGGFEGEPLTRETDPMVVRAWNG